MGTRRSRQKQEELFYAREQAVDLDTGAIVAMTTQGGARELLESPFAHQYETGALRC